MLHIILSKAFINDLEAIVTSSAYEVSSYIVIYVNIVKAVENISLRLDKL